MYIKAVASVNWIIRCDVIDKIQADMDVSGDIAGVT